VFRLIRPPKRSICGIKPLPCPHPQRLRQLLTQQLSMARGKPAKPIVVKVPRHGSQRIGASLTSTVLAVVRKDNKSLRPKSRTRYKHNSNPPSGALAQAIVSLENGVFVYRITFLNFWCRSRLPNGIRYFSQLVQTEGHSGTLEPNSESPFFS